MAKVAPAPDFDGVGVTAPTASVQSLRRKSTLDRYAGLTDIKKDECRTFHPLSQLNTRHALLATGIVCTLLMLLVGVPYAVNERRTDANPMLQTATRDRRGLGIFHPRPKLPRDRADPSAWRLSPAFPALASAYTRHGNWCGLHSRGRIDTRHHFDRVAHVWDQPNPVPCCFKRASLRHR